MACSLAADKPRPLLQNSLIILGRIRVAWHPNGEEEVVREKNVGLADRSLMPGDVVRRLIAGKDTQRGRILKMYFFREKIMILEIIFYRK